MENKASLDGVLLKLGRAEKHLREVKCLCADAAEGECSMVAEQNDELQQAALRIHLSPRPSFDIALAAGDFLNCCRSALDHLVWQLVLQNGALPTRTQYPITTVRADFAGALKRGQLTGVSEAGIAFIESTQPYHAGNDAMRVLNHLNNIDKHRTLNVLSVVADSAELRWNHKGNGLMNMFIGNEELRDGAIFGEIAVSYSVEEMFPGSIARLLQMEVKGSARLFVAFEDVIGDEEDSRRVEDVLTEIFDFVHTQVIGEARRLSLLSV